MILMITIIITAGDEKLQRNAVKELYDTGDVAKSAINIETIRYEVSFQMIQLLHIENSRKHI